MPLRSRPILVAGVIAVIASFAFVRPKPDSRLGETPSRTALAPQNPIPASPHAGASLPADAGSACAELLRSGRFGELLRRASVIADPTARRRWLDACERLAPPPLLAEHALTLTENADRDLLLSSAIERWVLADPASLAEWAAGHLADSAELDLALARIVEHTDTLQRPTATALAWTALIHDPALRVRALGAVVREWAATDAEAALRFAETTPGLSPAERASLLVLFVPPVAET